jgi:hypothetical protein
MFFAAGRGPQIIKDPNIQHLRQQVADRLWSIVQDEESNLPPDKHAIQFVSFEDALKELAEMDKKSQRS